MKSLLDEELARKLELCLEFANTASWHASDQPKEHLHSYADLVVWAQSHGICDVAQGEALLSLANRQKENAEATLTRAIGLREAIYRIFAAQAHGKSSRQDDIDLLNAALADSASKARIEATDNAYHWGWVDDIVLDRVIWPIIHAAGELLTNETFFKRVGQCADDRGCGWLFIDLSKNQSRRWCDINDCGNRAKQRRYQQRQREV